MPSFPSKRVAVSPVTVISPSKTTPLSIDAVTTPPNALTASMYKIKSLSGVVPPRFDHRILILSPIF